MPDDRRPNRILWLVNHTTLRDSEVPLLVGLGYEVFTPKSFPVEHRSASATYEWDATLTIPPEHLELLNGFDFYESRMDMRVRHVLNEYFGIAIVSYHLEKMDALLENFAGHIVLRAFGLQVDDFNYYSFAADNLRPGFRARLMAAQDRFWFGQAYPNLMEIEPAFLQRRAVTLPLGLPNSIWRNRDTWAGTERRILFVCPDIGAYDIAKADYQAFKRVFGGLPHVIAGRQYTKVDDPNVLGIIPRAEYDGLLRSSAVMFYHSVLPRHLHYHPLEAVCFGMPLVFMRDGMLGALGGRDLPGACGTFGEARQKIQRILSGDRGFADEIRSSQHVLLEQFEDEWIQRSWSAWLGSLPPKPDPDRQHAPSIAVLLAEDQSEDACRTAVRLARSLLDKALGTGGEPRIVLGLPRRHMALGRAAARAEPRLRLRELDWVGMSVAEAQIAQELSGHRRPLFASSYALPSDGTSGFQDCDLWLVVAAHLPQPVAPVRRLGLVVTDSLRWYPGETGTSGNLDSMFSTARTAEAVLSPSMAVLDQARQALAMDRRWFEWIRLPQDTAPRDTAPRDTAPWAPEAGFDLAIASEAPSDRTWILGLLRAAAATGRPRSIAIGLLESGWSEEQEEELWLELSARHSAAPPPDAPVEVMRVPSFEDLAGQAHVLALRGPISHAWQTFRAAAAAGCVAVFPRDAFLQRVAQEEGVACVTLDSARRAELAAGLRAAFAGPSVASRAAACTSSGPGLLRQIERML